MKKLYTIVFAVLLMVNTIVIFCVLLIKQIKLLYVMFGCALLVQILGVFIICLIACSKNPFIQVVTHKYIVLDSKDMPKGGKK